MSDSFILFSLLLYGCIWGSFLMVVGLRVPLHQSIISTPSHCPHCQHRLSAFELIPVLSYLLQRGTCYQCHRKIPPLYPLTESLAAGLLALSYFKANGDLFFFLQLFLLLTFGLIFFVSDLSYQLLPDVIMLPFLLLSLVWIFYAHPTQLMIRGFTGLVFFLAFQLDVPFLSRQHRRRRRQILWHSGFFGWLPANDPGFAADFFVCSIDLSAALPFERLR